MKPSVSTDFSSNAVVLKWIAELIYQPKQVEQRAIFKNLAKKPPFFILGNMPT